MSCILIVGAGESGLAAAGALRESGFVGRVLIVGDEVHHPYARPPLSKAVLTEAACPPEPIRNTQWLEQRGIELWLGATVAAIDTNRHTASIERDGSLTMVTWSRLLLATGTRPRRLNMLEQLGDRLAYLRSWDEAVALRSRLARARSVAIVGGGVIGLEVASSATRLGCSVTVIEPTDRLMGRAMAASGSDLLQALHRAAGVDVRLRTGLACVERDDRRVVLRLSNGSMIDAELVVAAIGVVPNDDLARAIGCRIDNGVVVDGQCQTSIDHVFAAGDVARFAHPVFADPIRIEAWQHARRHGAHAAAAMLDTVPAYAEIPWFWTDQHGVNVQVAGLPGLADTHISRGATTLHLKDGRLVAATTIDNGRDMRPAIKMIAAGWTGPAATLGDAAIPLSHLALTLATQQAN